MRRIIVALLALTTPTHAQSVAFTYDQWERLPIGMKELYVAGAVDWLSTVSTSTEVGNAKYYNDCLMKRQVTAHDLAEEMKVIVQTRLELHPKPATGALLASLIKVCGTPVPVWPSPAQ
jgi:hypothetical protein